MNHEVHKLAIALAAAFLIPGIGYVMGLLWSNSAAKAFGTRPDRQIRKLAATFFLALPMFLLAVYVRFDFDGLRDWWLQSPLLVTVVALLLLVPLPAFLIRTIVKVWRTGDYSPEARLGRS